LLRLLGLAIPAGTVVGALLSTACSSAATAEAVTNIVIIEPTLVIIACARILLVICLVSVAAWCGSIEYTLPHLLSLVNLRVVLVMLIRPALLSGLRG